VRMKSLFKKMLLEAQDYSGPEMEVANHSE
jgi:hypothetical protein